MAVQHKNLPDNQLHEPKGAVTASNGTMYIANGTGSGVWSKLALSNFTGIAGDGGSNNYRLMTNGSGGIRFQLDSAYGAMSVSANNAAIALSAATDSTLNTNTDYVLLDGAGVPWVGENLSSIVFSTGGLTVPVAGVYSLQAWLNITQFPTDTSTVAFKLRINGNPYTARKVSAKSLVAGSMGNVGVTELLTLSTGDIVQVYVASSASGNLIIGSGSVSLNLIKAS